MTKILGTYTCTDLFRSRKSDLVQFKRGFKTGAFLLVKMGILQATLLLWGIGLLRDKFASKMGSFGSQTSLFETLFKLNPGQFSTPDYLGTPRPVFTPMCV